MKSKICLALIGLLACLATGAFAEEVTSRQDNLTATRQQYSDLISGETPRIAELSLLINMLPKGGDLHHHYSGAIYAETYLDWVKAREYCIYSATDAGLQIKKFQIETKPQSLNETARTLCLSVDATRQDNSFYRELLERWSDKDYTNHFQAQLPPDQQFFNTFSYFAPISSVDYHAGLQSLKIRAQQENLGYLETMLKGGPTIDKPELAGLLNGLNNDATPTQLAKACEQAYDLLAGDADTNRKVEAYLQELTEAAAGLDDAGFTLRFQAYVSRNTTPANVFSSLYTSFAAARRSKLIVGVNIVGPENGFIAMRDYSLHMKMFAFLKERFPGVKLSLHAGELTLGMVPPEGLRSHIREAVLVAGAERIGHGVDIAYETEAQELLKIMKERAIAVEINLTSNAFILGVRDEAHPVRLYARFGVPLVISSDDTGVSRNDLSGEYLLYASRYRPSYDELKELVYNSIRFSFLTDAEKEEELTRLDRRFALFEAKIAALPPLAGH